MNTTQLQESLYTTMVKQMLPKSNILSESDLVLDRSSLVRHIKTEIMDYIDTEIDIERLSAILKFVTKKIVSRRGNKYVVSKDEVTEAVIAELNKL